MTAIPDHQLDPTATDDTASRRRRGLRPLLLRLHFYAGIFIGPFILVAAVTGRLYALIPQIPGRVTAGSRSI